MPQEREHFFGTRPEEAEGRHVIALEYLLCLSGSNGRRPPHVVRSGDNPQQILDEARVGMPPVQGQEVAVTVNWVLESLNKTEAYQTSDGVAEVCVRDIPAFWEILDGDGFECRDFDQRFCDRRRPKKERRKSGPSGFGSARSSSTRFNDPVMDRDAVFFFLAVRRMHSTMRRHRPGFAFQFDVPTLT